MVMFGWFEFQIACVWVCGKSVCDRKCVCLLLRVWVCDSFHMLSCVICPPPNNYHLCQINQRDFLSFFPLVTLVTPFFFKHQGWMLLMLASKGFFHTLRVLWTYSTWGPIRTINTLWKRQIARLVPLKDGDYVLSSLCVHMWLNVIWQCK